MKIILSAACLWVGVSLLCLAAPAWGAEVRQMNLDLTSEPSGVLPDKTLHKLWGAYKSAKECLLFPHYDTGTPMALQMQPESAFRSNPWVSPFTQVSGSASCAVAPPSVVIPPDPIPTVKLDQAYGQRNFDVDSAERWLRQMATYYRYSNDPVVRTQLHDAVLDWAKGNGLGQGIHVSYGRKPVDYQMQTAIFALLNAAAVIADSFTADDRAVIGPWLNSLVAQVGASYDPDRENDHAFLRDEIVLVWGILTGDDQAVQNVVLEYKLGLHMMRPDGSWPVDSQRGGNGIDYNMASTGDLLMIAETFQQALGVDLFSYSVDGRSIHDAVDWVVKSIEDPGGTNSVYAISCPGAGDRWGSIDHPNTHILEISAGVLLEYASLFPDRPSSKFLADHFSARGAVDDEMTGGEPNCLFADSGGTPALAPLSAPPADAHRIRTATETSPEGNGATDDAIVDDAWITQVASGRSIDYYVHGRQGGDGPALDDFYIAMNGIISTKDASRLADKCHVPPLIDGGNPHLRFVFQRSGTTYTVPAVSCIESVLAKDIRPPASDLITNFVHVASDMVESGSVDLLVNTRLKAFIRAVAGGTLTVRLSSDIPPAFKTETHEAISHTTQTASDFNSLFITDIAGGQRLRFNVRGSYVPSANLYMNLSFALADRLPEAVANALVDTCHAWIERWDDGPHLVIPLAGPGPRFSPVDLACLLKPLPGPMANQASYLASNFDQIARDMAASHNEAEIVNDHLRTLIDAIASGNVTIGAAH